MFHPAIDRLVSIHKVEHRDSNGSVSIQRGLNGIILNFPLMVMMIKKQELTSNENALKFGFLFELILMLFDHSIQ